MQTSDSAFADEPLRRGVQAPIPGWIKGLVVVLALLLNIFIALFVSQLGGSDSTPAASNVGAWDYRRGGDDWNQGACASGTRQSPINFNTTEITSRSRFLIFNYQAADRLWLDNKGSTLEVTASDGNLGGIFDNSTGETYLLRSFHIHCPSEHTINGIFWDCEIHFVHQLRGSRGTDNLMVVGVMLNYTDNASMVHPFFNTLFASIPARTTQIAGSLDVGSLVGASNTYLVYNGSLTTPTCDETVRWHVIEQPAYISRTHFLAMNGMWAGNPNFAGGHGNNRNVQGLRMRTPFRAQGHMRALLEKLHIVH